MSADLATLKRLADAATPGPWRWHWRDDETAPGSIFSEHRQGQAIAVAMCPRYGHLSFAADAAYIAACSPKVILALVDELERARAVIDSVDDFDLHGYHYWRECPACGHAEGGYLHCAHDGAQSPCHKCGVRMPTLAGECRCEFVLTHDQIVGALAEYRAHDAPTKGGIE